MASFTKSTYTDSDVEVDGNEYHGCTFNNTVLVFKGVAPPSFLGCTFNNHTWRFEDAALLTLHLTVLLYREDPGFRVGLDQAFRGETPPVA